MKKTISNPLSPPHWDEFSSTQCKKKFASKVFANFCLSFVNSSQFVNLLGGAGFPIIPYHKIGWEKKNPPIGTQQGKVLRDGGWGQKKKPKVSGLPMIQSPITNY
jgi:hypothetical protein